MADRASPFFSNAHALTEAVDPYLLALSGDGRQVAAQASGFNAERFVYDFAAKQKTAWTNTPKGSAMLFAGAAAYLLAWRRSPGDVVRLTTPFVLVAGLSLALGTPEYRFDVFRAQSFPSISIHDAQFWLRSGLLPNLLMWAVPAWWIVEGRRSVRVDDALALVICAAVVSGTWAGENSVWPGTVAKPLMTA